MATTERRVAAGATHEVRNQAPPFEGRNLFEDNLPLVEALEREGGGWARERASEVGARWGAEPMRWGFEANEHPPKLHTHDRFGNRIDEVEFHPAWHDLMAPGDRRRDALAAVDVRPARRARRSRGAVHLRGCRPRPASPAR